MKLTTCILIFLIFANPTKSIAQLWRYLNYDPKTEKVFEKALDKEACSVSTGSEEVDGEKSTYKIRTYCIKSFDGNTGKIAISERSHGHMLSIEGPGNSIKITDISGLIKVHFLNSELLEVVYSPRGGSDQGFDYVMILGINKDRLCIATEFLTINEYTIPDEYHLREVRLKLQGQTLHDCQLIATVRNILKSSTNRSKNYDRKSEHVLLFDKDRKIFYSKIKHLNAVFKMDTSAGTDKLLTGDFPMVDLGPAEKYYYIDDTWYALTGDVAGKKSILSKVH